MKITGDLENMKIHAPVLAPFRSRDFVVCPACGIAADGWWRRTIRKIRGKRPTHIVKMRYCPGDKPPSEKVESPFSMMFGPHEVIHGCSGIPSAHLHCTCEVCGAQWYTELKEGA